MFKNTFFRNYFLTTVPIALLAFGLLTSCEPDETQNLTDYNWTLVWSDEFTQAEGTGPASDKWAFDIGTGTNGWGNQELQYYTNRTQNAAVDTGGALQLIARQESFSGSQYTSARITTKNTFKQQYGRFEARIQTPFGPGIWPAFWLLGANSDTVIWPQCGEIDIMEQRGQQPHLVHSTIHGPGYSAGEGVTKPVAFKNVRFDTDFHVYAAEWFPDRIDFFVDGFLYHRIKKTDITSAGDEWVYDHDFFIILNVAVGGTYVGSPNTSTRFPQTMRIDYVRVYERGN